MWAYYGLLHKIVSICSVASRFSCILCRCGYVDLCAYVGTMVYCTRYFKFVMPPVDIGAVCIGAVEFGQTYVHTRAGLFY